MRTALRLVPAALAISAVVPGAVTPLLMVGGAFLCFEGCEKVWHKLTHKDEERHAELINAVADPAVDLVAVEKDKIKGAIRTDFILSAEIVTIALGTVSAASFGTRVAVLVGLGLLMTVGVYGLVAAIVKLDDAGLYLSQRASRAAQALGRGILRLAPWLMKSLSVLGTAAMFMVGGGILVHGLPPVEAWVQQMAQGAAALGAAGPLLAALTPTLLNALLGILAGLLALPLASLGVRLWQAVRPTKTA